MGPRAKGLRREIKVGAGAGLGLYHICRSPAGVLRKRPGWSASGRARRDHGGGQGGSQ